jgi:hypothetical protein
MCGSRAGAAGALATIDADRVAASHETLAVSERLSNAAKFGDLRAARAALDQGADPSALDNECVPPLHWAAGFDHPSMINLLVSRGADINAPSCQGATKDYPALVYATVMGKKAAVQALLELGADTELPAERSALLAAAGFGHSEIVEVLLVAGANPLALLDGGLPHAVAFLAGHFDLAAKLLLTETIAAVMRLRDALDAARARGPLGSPAAHKLAALLEAPTQPDRADWEKTRESYAKIMEPLLRAVQPDELMTVGEEWGAADTVRALLLLRKPYHCGFIIRHSFWPFVSRVAMLVICWKLLRRYLVLQRLCHLVYSVIKGMFSITAAVFRLLPPLVAVAWRALKRITRRRRPPALPARRGITHPPRRQRQNAAAAAANADAASHEAPRREAARTNRRVAGTLTTSSRAVRTSAAASVQPEAVPATVMQRDSEPAPLHAAAHPSAAVAAHVPPEVRTVVEAPPLAPMTPILPPPPPPLPLAEEEECVVCMDAPCEGIFSPCRHQVACIGCANKLRRSGASCPICRAHIHRVIVVKYSDEK